MITSHLKVWDIHNCDDVLLTMLFRVPRVLVCPRRRHALPCPAGSRVARILLLSYQYTKEERDKLYATRLRYPKPVKLVDALLPVA